MILVKSSQKPTALFIDAANCCEVSIAQLLNTARQQGRLEVMRAYGNFSNNRRLDKAALELFLQGVRLIHCPAWPNGSDRLKSTADETLMNDVCTCLNTRENLAQFIICSGDGHFVPTILALKEQGKRAIVMARPGSVSGPLKKAADGFIPLAQADGSLPVEVTKALIEAVQQLQKSQSRSAVAAGNVKAQMQKLLVGFDEKQYLYGDRPFGRFSEFLKAAQTEGWIRLIRPNRGDTLVTTKAELPKAA